MGRPSRSCRRPSRRRCSRARRSNARGGLLTRPTRPTPPASRNGQRRVGLAGRGREPGGVGLAAEVRAGVERLRQIARVLYYRHHVQPLVAVRMRRQTMNVLGDDGLLAVGHAVLPQIAFAEIRRHHFERPAALERRASSRRRTAAEALAATTRHGRTGGARPGPWWRFGTAADAWPFPFATREPLPGLLRAGLHGAIEGQQPGLRAGVEFELERGGVL